jgi:hypothetical protein
MELDVLKIDLDFHLKKSTINLLKERLSYLHDLSIFDSSIIKKIELIHKTKYSCKIYLKENVFDEKNIILLQLLLGSDWMKEANTFLNHFKYKMKYSNRLFDAKNYNVRNSSFAINILRKPKYKKFMKIAKITNVTDEILTHVLNPNRFKSRN